MTTDEDILEFVSRQPIKWQLKFIVDDYFEDITEPSDEVFQELLKKLLQRLKDYNIESFEHLWVYMYIYSEKCSIIIEPRNMYTLALLEDIKISKIKLQVNPNYLKPISAEKRNSNSIILKMNINFEGSSENSKSKINKLRNIKTHQMGNTLFV